MPASVAARSDLRRFLRRSRERRDKKPSIPSAREVWHPGHAVAGRSRSGPRRSPAASHDDRQGVARPRRRDRPRHARSAAMRAPTRARRVRRMGIQQDGRRASPRSSRWPRETKTVHEAASAQRWPRGSRRSTSRTGRLQASEPLLDRSRRRKPRGRSVPHGHPSCADLVAPSGRARFLQ